MRIFSWFLRGLSALGLACAVSSTYATCAITGTPSVQDSVTSGGDYIYWYTVFGLADPWCAPVGNVVGFTIPYFVDANVTGIVSLSGWSYSILADDFFGLGSNAQALEWTTTGPGIASSVLVALIENTATGYLEPFYSMPGSLSGFGYQSAYAPAKGPFWVSTQYGGAMGDPALPGSPDAIAAGLQPIQLASSVPEPGTISLRALGFAAFGLMGRIGRGKA